jgi:hyperosmotically inducible periplasmic protein
MKVNVVLSLFLVFAQFAITLAAEKQVSDDMIYDLVRRRLVSDTTVKGGALEVEVKEGVVTLRGSVEYEKQKDRATKVTKKVKGVKEVINELKVTHPSK